MKTPFFTALVFSFLFLIAGADDNTVFGRRSENTESFAKESEIAKKFVGKWQRVKENYTLELTSDGKCLWNGSPDGTWKVTGSNTIQQINRGKEVFTHTLSADNRTLSRPFGNGTYELVRYGSNNTSTPTASADSDTTPKDSAKPSKATILSEYSTLCEKYEKAFLAEIIRQNKLDESLVEKLLQKATPSNDFEFLQRAKNALDSIKKNEYISDFVPSPSGKSAGWDRELLKIKTERDTALKQAGKRAAYRGKRDFELLQKRAIQERDFDAAKTIAQKIATLGEVTVSPFTGTWQASWGHPNLIIIKNDDIVEGWEDRCWRQGKNLNEIEFYKKGSKWTSICKLSSDKNTLFLSDGAGQLWRKND
jgi:hypothetical protein